MKKLTPATMLLCIGFLFLLAGCSSLSDEIQNDISNNPKLKKSGIIVEVDDVNDGYVTLIVTYGLPRNTLMAIDKGRSLRDISMFLDSAVAPLIEVEDIIKKRPEVKAVTWKALVPDAQGGIPRRVPRTSDSSKVMTVTFIILGAIVVWGGLFLLVRFLRSKKAGSNE